MRLSFKQLKQLDVETASGSFLGHVSDVVFEIDGQLVAQYVVKVSFLSRKEYLISREQVVRFEEGKMVVDDSVSKVAGEEKSSPKVSGMDPSPVVMRVED